MTGRSALVTTPGPLVPRDRARQCNDIAAAFALIGAISALQVPDEEAAETMRPRGRQQEPVLAEAG